MDIFESVANPGEGTYPIPNGEMGINIQLSDNDGVSRENVLGLTAGDNSNWCSPSTWATAFLYTYTDIQYGTPVLDSDISDWDDEVTHGLFMAMQAMADPATDWGAYWSGMWDEEALYLLTVVTHDDVLCNVATNTYERDCFEVFIDLDNSKNQMNPANVWAGVHDVDADNAQLRVTWNNDEAYAATEGAEGVNPGQLPFEASQANAGTGWLVEWKISWWDYGILPTEFMGLDVSGGDNDAGTTIRENVVHWYEPAADNGWRDASVYGTARRVTGQTAVTDWQVLDR
jgi:hypothetical protein